MLEGVDLQGVEIFFKCFFLPNSNKSPIQNNSLIQLPSFFHKTLIKTNWKSKIQSQRLSSFSALKKTVTGVEGGEGKIVLFLSLPLSVHINLQYKLYSHTSLSIVTFCLLFSIALLTFCLQQSHCLFFLLFLYTFIEYV